MNSLPWILIAPLYFSIAHLLFLIFVSLMRHPKEKQTIAPANWPRAIVAIPHYNEEPSTLLKTIAAIEEQEYSGTLTVLLINDGSTNEIHSVLETWLTCSRRHLYIPITLPHNSGRKGKALDLGLDHFNCQVAHINDVADVIVIVDSDTYLARSALGNLIARLWHDDKCAAACGYVLPSSDPRNTHTILQKYEYLGQLNAFKACQDATGCLAVMTGAFVAHRVSAIKSLGGWGQWIVEDIAWATKAISRGYTTAYAPQAHAFTECPTTHRALSMQRRRWSRGRAEAFRVIIQERSLQHAILLSSLLFNYSARLLTVGYLPFIVLAMIISPVSTLAITTTLISLYCAALRIYFWRIESTQSHGIKDAFLCLITSQVMFLYLWWPCVLGFLDGLRSTNSTWLTRAIPRHSQ